MCCSAVSAATANGSSLTTLEKQLFGYEYKTDSDDARIARIETYLYGKNNQGSVSIRIKKASTDIGLSSGDVQPLPKLASKQAGATGAATPAYPKDSPEVEYPIVNKLETSVFKKTYTGESIYSRLDRLENKIYGSVSKDALSERVNKLRLAIMDNPNDYSGVASSDFVQGFDSSQDDLLSVGPANNSNDYNYVSPDTTRNSYLGMELTSAEQTLLNNSFEGEAINTRLSRVESSLFKRTFPSDDPASRMQRISAANTAKKTASQYDNNKFSRNLSTGMQIGSFLLMILAMIL